ARTTRFATFVSNCSPNASSESGSEVDKIGEPKRVTYQGGVRSMAQKDAFDELRKSKEEEYFRKQKSELLEQLRQKADAEAERRKMGEALETQDPQLLEDLQALGYTAETVKLLFAIPLVSVAWADGSVSARERSLILELAQGGSQKQLMEWLDQ